MMATTARQLSLFKGRKQKGVKPPLPLEFATQCAIADTLRRACVAGWLWSHFPSGENRDAGTGARLKRMGLKKGWADLLLISPEGVHHWLELKRGKAPLTEEQEAFRDACWARGVAWSVARSYDEAIAQLSSWGALRVAVTA